MVTRRYGLDDEVGVGVHDAVAEEFEALLPLVVGDNAEKGLKVLWRSEEWLFCVAP